MTKVDSTATGVARVNTASANPQNSNNASSDVATILRETLASQGWGQLMQRSDPETAMRLGWVLSQAAEKLIGSDLMLEGAPESERTRSGLLKELQNPEVEVRRNGMFSWRLTDPDGILKRLATGDGVKVVNAGAEFVLKTMSDLEEWLRGRGHALSEGDDTRQVLKHAQNTKRELDYNQRLNDALPDRVPLTQALHDPRIVTVMKHDNFDDYYCVTSNELFHALFAGNTVYIAAQNDSWSGGFSRQKMRRVDSLIGLRTCLKQMGLLA